MKIVVASGILKRPFIGVIGTWDPPLEQHKTLFQRLAANSRERNLASLVVTLDPPPEQIADGLHWPRHTDLAWRLAIQSQSGIAWTAVVNLDKSDTTQGASQFIRNLVSVFPLSELWLGLRQTFGRFRSGSQSEIDTVCKLLGIKLVILDAEPRTNQIPKHIVVTALKKGESGS